MTQLFDTTRYDHDDEPGQRLQSVELDTTATTAGGVPTRRHSWRLDDQTIAIGRRGIEMAREALRRAIPADSDSEHESADRKAA